MRIKIPAACRCSWPYYSWNCSVQGIYGYPIHYYRTGISAVHIGQWITENANSPYINSDFDFWMLFQQPSYINLKLMISDRDIIEYWWKGELAESFFYYIIEERHASERQSKVISLNFQQRSEQRSFKVSKCNCRPRWLVSVFVPQALTASEFKHSGLSHNPHLDL